MKVLVDAQLPVRLARELARLGHDVLHTSRTSGGNSTPDVEITVLAAREGRVVVTKDSDFVSSFLLRRGPPKLLLISVGNAPNDVLCPLVCKNFPALAAAFERHDFIELALTEITIHV